MIEVNKIEAGCYEVKIIEDNSTYMVIKDSYLGGWGIFDNDQTTYSHLLVSKNTKKECIDFLEGNFKDLSNINNVPNNIRVTSKFKVKGDKQRNTTWVIDDIVYSTSKGKWIVNASYYNDSIDCGNGVWDVDNFEEECEVEN